MRESELGILDHSPENADCGHSEACVAKTIAAGDVKLATVGLCASPGSSGDWGVDRRSLGAPGAAPGVLQLKTTFGDDL